MIVNILVYGQLRDILGEKLELSDVSDTAGLKKSLHKKYPAMKDAKYMLALNKKLVTVNAGLTENCTIAILSPFSGG